MPYINIEEQNLTTGAATIGTDIPYIPGFVGYKTADSVASPSPVPKIYTTLAKFESEVGYKPYEFSTEQTYMDATIIKQGEYDPSYIMAAELLKQGMPVYYHAFAVQPTGTYIESIGSKMYYMDADGSIAINPNAIELDDKSATFKITLNRKIDFETGDGANNVLKIHLYDKDNKLISNSIATTSFKPISEKLDTSGNIQGSIPANSNIEFTVTSSTTLSAIKAIKVGKEYSTTDANAMVSFYTDLSTFLEKDELRDRGEYTIKYITSGGYPNVFGNDFDLAIIMHNLAEDRGDCVAFIEDAWTETPELTGTPDTGEIGSLKYRLENLEGFSGMEFGTTFFGWGNHNLANKFDTKYTTARLPGCYSYLINLAKSIKTNPNWLAIAGVGRGHVSTFNSPAFNTRLSNKIADEYQPRIADPDEIVYAINAITKINPYGYTIWGNRTLKAITQDGLDATHFLNTRNMISDIKKLCYSAAKALMFEQNSELLWLDFKGRLTPYLDRLKISSGISGYSIIKGDSTAREELVCILKIYPISAVEAFDIRIVITDADVDVQ